MDRREGVEGVEKCLVHASMKHSWSQTLLKVGDRVSWADKLAMWSNSPDEEMVFRARARRRWHERALAGEWDALLSTAQEAAMEQAPLRIRELAISAARNLKAVGTTSPCAVNEYRGKTLESLGVLRQSIGAAYGMHGSRSDLMGAVAARLGEGENPEAPPLEEGAMRGLSYADVVEMAAAALAQTNYRDQYLVLTREMGAYDQAKSRVTAVKKDISFWDMVNVFTDTKEERERDDLKREMREKSLAIKSRSVKVNELFDAALAHYPPAVLYCRLGAVEVAVSSIYAKLVTRTYTDSKGRTRTSTSCNLYNKNRAVDQLAGWNAEMVAVFGRLPDVHECLQRWVSF
jgi:hypothetical protein